MTRTRRAPLFYFPLSIVFALALAAGCGPTSSPLGTPDAGTEPSEDDAAPIVPDPVCGDGARDATEACDDGNDSPGDGCSDACAVEADHACPVPNRPCVRIVVCGNSRIEGSETCDDGDLTPDDGCSADCAREPGWTCTRPGIACVAAECGDGLVAGFEACDDGDNLPDDGCDAACRLEDGFHCPDPGQPCDQTRCGDGMAQGLEECDDRNVDVGDGCTPFCKREPDCQNGACAAVCGDGVIRAPEQCDDGNGFSGDGCDAACLVEQGFDCTPTAIEDPGEAVIPVTLRDFVASCGAGGRDADHEGGTPPYGHPDFQCYENGLRTGMVQAALDGDGKPMRLDNDSTYSTASFALWYRTNADYNRAYADTFVLPAIGAGIYQLNETSLFPLNTRGFVVEDCSGSPCESKHVDEVEQAEQNFHFTSEVRFWFEYAGDEVLAFSGDDDVWVFINGHLAVDIGGVHGREDGSVDLGAPGKATELGLTVGGIYEAVVFQAERHTVRSQYRLTLTNFSRERSDCSDQCGDDEVSSREVCDDGGANGSGDGSGYGGCAADCTLEPYCGDSVVDAAFGEICDDGLNLGGVGQCAPGCMAYGGLCSDGVVQTDVGEQCDDGNRDDGDGCSGDCEIEVE